MQKHDPRSLQNWLTGPLTVRFAITAMVRIKKSDRPLPSFDLRMVPASGDDEKDDDELNDCCIISIHFLTTSGKDHKSRSS